MFLWWHSKKFTLLPKSTICDRQRCRKSTLERPVKAGREVFLDAGMWPSSHLHAWFHPLINWSNSDTRDDGRRRWWACSILFHHHERARPQLRWTDGKKDRERRSRRGWRKRKMKRKTRRTTCVWELWNSESAPFREALRLLGRRRRGLADS